VRAAHPTRRHSSFNSLASALLFLIVFLPGFAGASEPLVYSLRYDLKTHSVVHVTVRPPEPRPAPLTLIMPRSIPGAYEQRPYDPFVMNVSAYLANGDSAPVQRDELGPRWTLGKTGERVARVEYDVDVAKMEAEILAAADTSKIRDGYVGLLGYSVFAFLEGAEDQPIRLEIAAPVNWPVFSTLAPRFPASQATALASAPDYYSLADSQIVMGPKLQLRRIDGSVPLYLAGYAEGNADLEQEAALARDALDKVTAYFGQAPFTEYTVLLEFLRPVSPSHRYGFSMEHLNSGTFYLDIDHALTPTSTRQLRDAHHFNYAHHIAHSWIPKRVYSDGYLPFRWEMAPISETIWFNEGFGRYVAIMALADAMPKDEAPSYRTQKLAALRTYLDAEPAFLRRMSALELSREGSFLYSDDFRVGIGLFSRGALLAAEMDDRIQSQSAGKKSLRDALRHLVEWSADNQRAFRTDELPRLFREATGVDITDILDRWMRPLP
jgi:predicted metalloprotease with PDZ domain